MSQLPVNTEEINPCKCGTTRKPVLDSDDFVPCWGVTCYVCGQFTHAENWSRAGAIIEWNKANPVKQKSN